MPNQSNKFLIGGFSMFVLLLLIVPVVFVNSWWQKNHIADTLTAKLQQSVWIAALTIIVSGFLALFITGFIATILFMLIPRGGVSSSLSSGILLIVAIIFMVSFFMSLAFVASISVYIYQNLILAGYVLFLALIFIPLVTNLVLGVLSK